MNPAGQAFISSLNYGAPFGWPTSLRPGFAVPAAIAMDPSTFLAQSGLSSGGWLSLTPTHKITLVTSRGLPASFASILDTYAQSIAPIVYAQPVFAPLFDSNAFGPYGYSSYFGNPFAVSSFSDRVNGFGNGGSSSGIGPGGGNLQGGATAPSKGAIAPAGQTVAASVNLSPIMAGLVGVVVGAVGMHLYMGRK